MNIFKNKTKKISKIKNLKKLIIIVLLFLTISILIIIYGNNISKKQINLYEENYNIQQKKLKEIKINYCNEYDIYLSKNKSSDKFIIIYLDFSSKYNKKFFKTFKEIEKNIILSNESKINIVIRPISLNLNHFNLNKEFYLVLKGFEIQNLTSKNLEIIKYFLIQKIKEKNKLYSYINNLDGYNKDKLYKDINNESLISFYELYTKEEKIEVSPTIVINGKKFEGIHNIKNINKLLKE
jgi:hypothetical protein